MIRKIIVFVILTCVSATANAQTNLVRNGGFEQFRFCPYEIDQIGFANYWSGLDSNWNFRDSNYSSFTWCLPEYCNVCDKGNYPVGVAAVVGVPLSGWYYKWPRSGNGFAQERILDNDSVSHELSDRRDYLQGRFYSPLISGLMYCVTFYASIEQGSDYAIQNIGAYIDNGAIDNTDSAECQMPHTWLTPQVMASSIINDTGNWVKIQGSYIANGTEKFITIGNFSDYSHTNKISVNYSFASSGSGWTFYSIDDVSVIASDAIADAGPDTHCAAGDSVWIGTNEQGMPCTWYALGDTTHPIGYGGGVWVRPMATGTYNYVVMLDLCGHVTWDTMTLSVWPVSIVNGQLSMVNVGVYPNPAGALLHIDGGGGCSVAIYNVVGERVYSGNLVSSKETINIDNLTSGSYFVEVVDGATGYRVVRKVVKE